MGSGSAGFFISFVTLGFCTTHSFPLIIRRKRKVKGRCAKGIEKKDLVLTGRGFLKGRHREKSRLMMLAVYVI